MRSIARKSSKNARHITGDMKCKSQLSGKQVARHVTRKVSTHVASNLKILVANKWSGIGQACGQGFGKDASRKRGHGEA